MKGLGAQTVRKGGAPTCTAQRKAGPTAGKLRGTDIAADLEELLRVTKNVSNRGKDGWGGRQGLLLCREGEGTEQDRENETLEPRAQSPGAWKLRGRHMQTIGCHTPAGHAWRSSI